MSLKMKDTVKNRTYPRNGHLHGIWKNRLQRIIF